MNKQKNRGTQDDLELLKIIIEQDVHLKERVLSRIRDSRSDGQMSLLDLAKEESKVADGASLQKLRKK